MSLENILNKVPKFENGEILKAFVKGYSILKRYENPVCSISGGSDSDIMLDIIHRIDENNKVTYVWFDTGLEYQATKNHLKYLESKYNINIQVEKAIKPIPACTKEFGQPFLNKYVSEQLERLQSVNFEWEDLSYEELIEKYHNVDCSLKWWCNKYKVGEGFTKSMHNINYSRYLKEFIIENPPTFNISPKCCRYAKKSVSKQILKKTNCDLMISGVRKAEGGIRAIKYENCYEPEKNKYRPIFWFKDSDKLEYKKVFNIKYSDCYEKWGFTRTGCVCCPYGSKALYKELSKVLEYEPKMYIAVNNIFENSYAYTNQYKQFIKNMKYKENGRRTLF